MRHRPSSTGNASVSILTPHFNERRYSDAANHGFSKRFGLRAYALMLLVCALLACALIVNAGDWQENADIIKAAESYAKDKFGKTDERVAPVAGYLDPRLRLARCDAPLQPFVRPGTKVTSRIIIGVRCSGTRPWKVYVPVDVVVMQAVLVTKKTLPRGHVITAADILLEKHDVSRLGNGYISSLDELSGRKLKHQIMGGRVLTPAMLSADIMVRRGQTVTLIVSNEHMNISMSGKALADGALNQRIRVENLNSQRVVEGLVRSPQTVEILVHN